MAVERLHRFEHDGKRFAIDPETCFCFECDGISWDVLEHYPQEPVNRIFHLLSEQHDLKELSEVIGELEWLRATKSILKAPKRETLLKEYEVERGLKRVSIRLPEEEAGEVAVRRRWFGGQGGNAHVLSNRGRKAGEDAVTLLLGRSEAQKELRFEVVERGGLRNPKTVADLYAHAMRAAKTAGKKLTFALCVEEADLAKQPEALAGHAVGFEVDFEEAAADVVRDILRDLTKVRGESFAKAVKAIQPEQDGVTGRMVVRPCSGEFGDVVEALDKAGLHAIKLDLDGAYASHPDLDTKRVLESLYQSAVYYAERLLKHHYFRVDPLASVFWRVYMGQPQRRYDGAGVHELAIDESGDIYPSKGLIGVSDYRVGSLSDGTIDESALVAFNDVGALTTPPCMRCWVRYLCGGGPVAVHHARTGSFRRPDETWCEAQRSWMAAAVSAFQALSSAGVHFERVYKTLGKKEKPSLFAMARMALMMTVGVRPIAESDAPMLAKWGTWDESAYFAFNESGVLLATQYDREMDALHPKGLDPELILQRKNGDAFGLFKLRPDRIPGLATGWLYMRDDADYASDAVRKGFKAILKETGGQQSIRRLIVPAAPWEQGLKDFLKAVGFGACGVQREALYLHGKYHDVTFYELLVEQL